MKILENLNFEEKHRIDYIDQLAISIGDTLPPAAKNLRMAVIIPAKDESEIILQTLKLFLRQKDQNKTYFDTQKFEIIILCHNCSDDSYEKCKKFFERNPRLQGHVLALNSDVANNVGSARRLLMNIAFKRLEHPNGLIISTDADTIPNEKWLYQLEKHLESNIDLVCGIIVVKPQNLPKQAFNYLQAKDEYLLLKARLESKFLPKAHDPWPRHNYHWGPNLAIKKRVYGEVGGIRPMHFLEDVDLYHRVLSKGYLARHDNDVIVTTSTRVGSRCEEGFGAELLVWSEWEGVEYNVEGLTKLLMRFEIYRLIQEYYETQDFDILLQISQLSRLEISYLNEVFSNYELAEAAVIHIEKHLDDHVLWNKEFKNISILSACTELKEFFDIE